ncbi:hypothetical protein WJX81_005591 [Elliptochloris bilobata]|uniref:DNA primase large subunit n=1 Tax=Elliptochloris bilobata TaxID=381761 RepID=A0AAW1RWL3_9CHLO
MYVNKWHTFGVSALLQCTAGVSYCFAVYAGALKEALGLTQAQIQGAASPLWVTLVLQWMPGAIYDSLAAWPRLGPRVTLAAGLAAMSAGYGGLWLAASGRAAPPYWALVGLTAVAFAGGSWVDTACIATNVRNFPGHRGTIVGVLKSFAGLSASVFTAVYLAAFRPDAAAFLASVAAAPVLLGVVALPLFNAVPFQQDASAEAPHVAGARFMVAQNVVLLLAAGVVTMWAGAEDELRAPLLSCCKGDVHGLAITANAWCAVPAELTLVQCAASPDYWLLFGVLGTGTGCGLLFSNNLGQLVQTLGGAPDGQAALVALFSVASAAGRLAAGHLPERALHAWRTPRPVYLVATALLTASAMALAACADLRVLWLVASLCGFAYGCHWSLGPALSSELFGLRRFATLYCLLNYSTTLGAYLLATRLAGTLYERAAVLHSDPDNVCLGADCFRGTFLAAALVELCAAGLAAALFWRTRRRGNNGRGTPAVEVLESISQRISMYLEPPPGEVTIEDFERVAIDRLRVLKGLEEARARGMKGEQLQAQAVSLAEKHLKGSSAAEARWRDAVSHWVLRLAYCRSEELRRWFLTHECDLFRARFRAEPASSQVDFMRHHALLYQAVEGGELEALRPQLVAVQEALGNFAFAGDVRQGAARDTFFKVPFERVPDLVAQRRVLLRGGWAYVSRHEVASLLAGHFRVTLSRGLAAAARRWASGGAAEEADRLAPILEALSQRYLGPDYGDENAAPRGVVMAAALPALARQSFPLCMKMMYERVETDHHLKHSGRLQLGLFLKGLGLPLEEAMRFWRAGFAPRCAGDEFDKKYAYNVRYNYAKEGKRTDYTPYSCLKIISTPVPKGDAFGCPYKTLSAAELAGALARLRLPPRAADEATARARAGHFQLACASAFEGAHGCACETGINHPNQYFDESQKVLVERAAAAAGTPASAQQVPVTPGAGGAAGGALASGNASAANGLDSRGSSAGGVPAAHSGMDAALTRGVQPPGAGQCEPDMRTIVENDASALGDAGQARGDPQHSAAVPAGAAKGVEPFKHLGTQLKSALGSALRGLTKTRSGEPNVSSGLPTKPAFQLTDVEDEDSDAEEDALDEALSDFKALAPLMLWPIPGWPPQAAGHSPTHCNHAILAGHGAIKTLAALARIAVADGNSMFGSIATASAETLTSVAHALRALAGSPDARPAFADGSGMAALVAVLRCSTPAAYEAAADACCSLAAKGFELSGDTVAELLGVAEQMYRFGPARAAAAALVEVAASAAGRDAICAIPNGIRRLLDLLGPSQDAIVGASICEVLAHLAASKSGCKALADADAIGVLARILARPVHSLSPTRLALRAAAARALAALVADSRSARRVRWAGCMRALHAQAAGSGTRDADDAAAAARAVLNEIEEHRSCSCARALLRGAAKLALAGARHAVLAVAACHHPHLAAGMLMRCGCGRAAGA